MIQVPLNPVANQAMSMVLGGNVYDISVRYASAVDNDDGQVVISVSINDIPVLSSQRCVSHAPVLWDSSMEAPDGSNLVWLCSNGSEPKFEGFNMVGGCNLVWATAAEMATLRETANVI